MQVVDMGVAEWHAGSSCGEFRCDNVLSNVDVYQTVKLDGNRL